MMPWVGMQSVIAALPDHTHVILGAQKNRLNAMILLGTHNIIMIRLRNKKK